MLSSSFAQVPQEWLCPITYEIMEDPVICPDGRSYERSNIIEWLRVHGTSPFTRESVSIDQLIPNLTLRDLIHKRNVKSEHKEPTKTIYCLIDRSGSMGMMIHTPGYENDGFNRLDLVKHSVRTIIHSLTPDYSLGIVSFSESARLDMEPMCMNGIGKARATHIMERITQSSTTNIWDGIRLIMSKHSRGDSPTIFLFTDGESNIDPPRGILPTLTREITRTGVNPTIYTLGFGYDINSAILHDIGSITGGLFGFIPDCTMIGSVFVNLLAHSMSGSGGESTRWPELVSYIARVTNTNYTYTSEHTEKQKIMELLDRLVLTYENDSYLRNVCEDLQHESPDKGQIGKAVSNPRWFKSWGIHYLRSLHLAHSKCACINFKDSSLQDYKTPGFTKYQDRIEDVFVNLPSPIPSNLHIRNAILTGSQAPTPMSVYYNASSGCFTGSTLIRVCDARSYKIPDDEPHRYRPIRDLRVGDWVVSANQESAKIRFITRFVNHKSHITQLSNTLTISAYHPVRRYMALPYGYTPEWEFPCDIAGASIETHDLYNLVLENGSVIYTPSHECVVFGHGLFTNDIVSHDYFGTNAIVDDIAEENEKQGGNGFVIVHRLQEIRDSTTGKVIKYVFNQ